MATNDSSQALDPSDYIEHHLQNFSATSSSGIQHAGAFISSPYALVLAAVLFFVLVGFAAFRDKGAMFSVGREISIGRRLYVWWSCAWRQWLASTLLFIVAVMAFHFLVPRTAVPLMKFSEHLITPELARSSPAWSEVIAAMPAIVAVVIYLLVSLPIAGYMVRSGLVAHAFPHPERFGFWHALMLGLTTYAWEVPGSLAIADLAISLPAHAADVLRAILVVAWGMYVVLPRQVRRVGRLAAG
ncbi:hypothetical protein BH160DRAFT_1077 [Burkholderia sp. H160]|nr:hypothetical protein BH160DRAFT_1077 [Burkholderia sp. H160]